MTLRENHSAFHRIWLKPRVLVNVKQIDTSTSVLGSSEPSRAACLAVILTVMAELAVLARPKLLTVYSMLYAPCERGVLLRATRGLAGMIRRSPCTCPLSRCRSSATRTES